MEVNENNKLLKQLLIKKHSGLVDDESLIIIIKNIMDELSISRKLLVGFRESSNFSKEFFLMNDDDGLGDCFAVYTDIAEYQKWDYSELVEPIEITFLDLVYYVIFEKSAKGIIINPFSEDFKLDYELIEYVAESAIAKQENNFLYYDSIGVSDYNDHVADNIENRLYELANTYKGINRVWVRNMNLSVEQAGLFLFDLDINTNLDIKKIVNDNVLCACCHKVVLLEPNNFLSKEIIRGSKPMYTKVNDLKS